MDFLTYLFITLALAMHCTKSSSISSSDDEPITNTSIIKLSKQRSKRYSRGSENRRIFGGQYVKDFSMYPFMVCLLARIDDNQSELCTGTLISKTHVLTAAHCVRTCHCITKDDDDCFNRTIYKTEDFTLYFGNIVPANSKVKRTLKNIYIHEEYKTIDLTHKCNGRFDIAVLELSTPVPYSQTIQPITLPKPVTLYKDELSSTMTSSFFDKKKKCTILGWGDVAVEDNQVIMTRRLKVASVPLIGYERCIDINLNSYKLLGFDPEMVKTVYPTAGLCTDTSFCSKCPHSRNGACGGDSGGPIICGGVKVGVTSGLIGECGGSNIYNTYTRVDINVQWIKSIMSNKHDRMQNEY